MEILVWRAVARYVWKLEKYRIQSVLQLDKKTSEKINRTRLGYP